MTQTIEQIRDDESGEQISLYEPVEEFKLPPVILGALAVKVNHNMGIEDPKRSGDFHITD
jgi:hypothetical protein